MKKILVVLAILIATVTQVWAFDFADSSSGPTLYYRICGSTLSVTNPGDGYTMPVGIIRIPSTVTHNGTLYQVTAIDANAFNGCCDLLTVTVPNTVTAIGSQAFRVVRNIRYFGTATGSPWGALSRNGYIEYPLVFADNTKTTLLGCAADATTADIPDGVTSIGNRAFYGCTDLTSVNIPSSVTSIGTEAFYNCRVLTSVDIPDGVPSIGDRTFYECMGLTSVTIPSSVTSIGQEAFYNCRGLISVTIPSSVTSIGNDAFYTVKNIVYVGTATGSPWSALSRNGYFEYPFIYYNSVKTKIFGCATDATTAVIPNSVTYIGCYAFSNCTRLTSVTIPNSVTTIRWYAFSNCTSLNSVTIGNNVNYLGSYLFLDCVNLTSVTIPNSVRFLGYCAFAGCRSLNSATIGNSVTVIGDSTFAGCRSLNSVTLGNSVTEIRPNAFRNCTNLNTVTLGKSVNTIRGDAFSGCSNIRTIICKSRTPPQLLGNCLDYVSPRISVIIPCGSMASYSSSQWNRFSNFVEGFLDSLYVSSADETQGTVTILTQPDCASPIAEFSATPNTGYHFHHWSDGSTDNPRSLTVTQDSSLVAYFASDVSIPNVMLTNYTVSTQGRIITVTGAKNARIRIFDSMGRLICTALSEKEIHTFAMPSMGVYVLQVGNYPAERVVVRP